MTAYNSSSIKVLEGLEAVRLRPGMYIGSTGVKGLHHLIYEILDNAVDEFLAGHCSLIKIKLKKDGSVSIEDNGRGMPVDIHEKGYSAARVIFTILHAGGKFNNDSYKVSGGLHGVGASVVNALSKWLEVKVFKDGNIYQDRYENGGNPSIELINGELPVIGNTRKTGTMVSFLPDDSIFETIQFKSDVIKKRLKEIAYLNKNLSIVYENEIENETITYLEKDGIVGFMKEINKSKDILSEDILYISGKNSSIELELAIQYTKDYSENILSFCNNINTVEGGTHVSGLKTSLTRIINQYARELGILKDKDANFEGRDVRNGLTAILLLKHPNPQYEGQTKTKLGNSDARGVVDELVSFEISKFFDKNVEIAKDIISNALRSQKLRNAEENARNKISNKSALLTANSKLAACQKKNPEEIELFLVEGDSAGGSAKQGRDRAYQAILALKGKILNVEKQNIGKIIGNDEIATLISVSGCGFGEGLGEDFDIKKLKYGKIIILTDADVDGSHIRTLLLTLFYRFMPELIYEGKIFIGIPPLFKISQGSTSLYLYTDNELKIFENYYNSRIDKMKDLDKLNNEQLKIIKKISKNKTYEIQRYKGLGEMNPEQLWETTLNPKTRYLKQVVIEDAVLADEITTILMGNKVPPRREFIENEAEYADIDI